MCITFHYLPHFPTRTYAKSHSAPQTPSCVGHTYGMCKGLWPSLFPNSLLNAGYFSFLANALALPDHVGEDVRIVLWEMGVEEQADSLDEE